MFVRPVQMIPDLDKVPIKPWFHTLLSLDKDSIVSYQMFVVPVQILPDLDEVPIKLWCHTLLSLDQDSIVSYQMFVGPVQILPDLDTRVGSLSKFGALTLEGIHSFLSNVC
jgi:hypothetical protein